MSAQQGPRRQKGTKPPSMQAAELAVAAFTGTAFVVDGPARARKRSSFDLSAFPRPELAAQVAAILREEAIAMASGCPSHVLAKPQSAVRQFGSYILSDSAASGISRLQDVTRSHVDGFEAFLRGRFPNSRTGQLHLGAMISLLDKARTKRLIQPGLAPRLAYVSSLPPIRDGAPLEPYPAVVMAAIRKAAQADVLAAIAAHGESAARASRGRDPELHGWMDADNASWHLHHRGAAPEFSQPEHKAFRRATGRTRAELRAQAYPSIEVAHAFAILIAVDTGINIECVHDLEADCLRAPRDGHATLHYFKARARGEDRKKTRDVSTSRRFAAGWLVETFLAISEDARRHAPAAERRWLFVGYVKGGRRLPGLRRLVWSKQTADAFAWRHRIEDDEGRRLATVHASRIRKSASKRRYERVGGDLARFADDHCRQVAATHYARIAANASIHEDAISRGLSAALAAASRTRTAEEVPAGADDVAVAGCLDFTNSPYSEKGRACGEPLLGCLDCPNAVVTPAKIPALLHLLRDVAGKRQEMDLETWSAIFGAAYVRIMAILERFPRAALEAAIEEADATHGRSWSPVQLAYRI